MADVFVTFIVDNSGSMNTAMNGVRVGLSYILSRMSNDTANRYHIRAVDVGYGHGLHDYVRINDYDDPNDMATGWMPIPGGGTPLYDSIERVFNTINDPAGLGHHAICILITDGGEGGSIAHHDWDEIRNLIRDKVHTGWYFAYLCIQESKDIWGNPISEGEATIQAKAIYNAINEEGDARKRMIYKPEPVQSSHHEFMEHAFQSIQKGINERSRSTT